MRLLVQFAGPLASKRAGGTATYPHAGAAPDYPLTQQQGDQRSPQLSGGTNGKLSIFLDIRRSSVDNHTGVVMHSSLYGNYYRLMNCSVPGFL